MSAGTGSTIDDLSGLGNHGTTACAWSTQGRHKFGITLDGSCSITISDHSSLHFSTGFTIEAWVFPTSSTSYQAIVTKNYDWYLYSSIGGWCGSGNAVLGGFEDTSSRNACHPVAIPLNQWTHLAVTYDGATIKLYKDTTVVSSTSYTGTIASNTGTLQIGNNQFNEGFIGVVDDVYIYNYDVGAAQILTDSLTGASVTSTVQTGASSSLQIGAGSSIQLGQ